jgi:hypothetical protein
MRAASEIYRNSFTWNIARPATTAFVAEAAAGGIG